MDRLDVDTQLLRPRSCLQDMLNKTRTNGHAMEDQKCSSIEVRKIGPKDLVCFKCFHQLKSQKKAIGQHEVPQLDIPATYNSEKIDFKREGYFQTFRDSIGWLHLESVQAVEHNSLRIHTQRMQSMHEHPGNDAGQGSAGPSPPQIKRTEEEKEKRMDRARDVFANPQQWRQRQKEKRLARKAEQADNQKRIDSGAILEEWRFQEQEPTDSELAATSKETFPAPLPSWAKPRLVVKLPQRAATARLIQENSMTEPKLPPRQRLKNGQSGPQYHGISYRGRPESSMDNSAQQRLGHPSVDTTRMVVGNNMRAEFAPFLPGGSKYSADMPKAQTIASRSEMRPEAGSSTTLEQLVVQLAQELARLQQASSSSMPEVMATLPYSMQAKPPRPRQRYRVRRRPKHSGTEHGQPKG